MTLVSENRNNVYALVVAGGTGTRMGSAIPKQFLSVAGREMIQWSVHKFDSNSRIDRVIVLVPSEWVAHTDALFCDRSEVLVVAGGETRNDTVSIGLDLIDRKYGIDEETAVLVHDAARPLVTTEIIDNAIDSMGKYAASTVAMGVTDSVAVSNDGCTVASCPDRENIFMIQTPQTFMASIYRELYEAASEEERTAMTESTKLFIDNGYKVGIVEGSIRNMKVTRSGDIEILEMIYQRSAGRRDK